MQGLDVFLTRLIPYAQGCPEPLARQTLLDSAIELCEKTSIVASTTSIMSAPGVGTYYVELPVDQIPVNTQQVWYGDRRLTPLTNEGSLTGAGVVGTTPTHFYESATGEVTLVPTPTDSDVITFRVSSKPKRTATSVDDVLYENWVDAIVAGALKRIQSVPDTPYFSSSGAAWNGLVFHEAVSHARSEALHGRVSSNASVRARRFA